MNTKAVDALIPKAYQTLTACGIAEKGEIPNGFRGQIASFGAAVATGSLLSAIAFFSRQPEDKDHAGKGSDCAVPRHKLLEAIFTLLSPTETTGCKDLFQYAQKTDAVTAKELILQGAVALKLAMNLYTVKEARKGEKSHD
jgi:CRISPR-associated protein Cmr5